MLAGCSSLLSPRHRLRSEASTQLQACHYQLPSMSTQRLDLPCNFNNRKDAQRSQSKRSVGISVEKPFEAAKGSCSIRQRSRRPPLISTSQGPLWEGRREAEDGLWEEERKSLKRYAEQSSSDEFCVNSAKRRRGSSNSAVEFSEGEGLSVNELGSGSFWFAQTGDAPQSLLGITGIDTPSVSLAKEERVSYGSSDMILPPIQLSSNPWVEYVVTGVTGKGDRDTETSQAVTNANSGSSTSSESHSLTLRPEENILEYGTGNGSRRNSFPFEGARLTGGNGDVPPEHRDFELLSLLVACVESISSKNISAVTHFISRLGELASPEGSTVSRLTAYFTEALTLRVARLWPHIFHISIPRDIDRADDEIGSAIRLLNHVSPIPKFFHFTSNEMLLRAFEGKDRVHIIDFDIKQGLQWPSLFQSLATRTVPPSHVRITGIGESKQELQETGDRLAGFAAALNLPFEFHAVVDRLEDVRLWMLHVKDKETVAVNCIFQLHKLLYDGSGGALRDMLGLIQSTNPAVVLMAEQESEHDSPSLEVRVSNSLKYYSAIFDSIDSSLPSHSQVRIKIEEMFAREIRNIVSCEGSDRFERHVSFGKWRRSMEQGGFRCMSVGEREMFQSKMLLKMYSSEEYNLEKQGEDGAGLTLKWLDQPLFTVSAWAPVQVTGSSSSMIQPS